MLDKIKGYLPTLGKGLLLQVAPNVARGLIREYFKQWNVTVEKVVDDVKNNRSILDNMTVAQQNQLKGLGSINLDFFDAQFVIDSLKDDFPAVASLFASWTDANQWLVRQVNALKQTATSQ
jgi:predicted oxidoreductase (fatty acid repression mutant protein)